MVVAAWVSGSLVLGYAATALARRYALHRQLIDEPGERRSHTAATPRGGGISIVLVLLLAMAILAMTVPGEGAALGLAAAGLALVAGIGWIDDHRPLSPALRLAVHVVAGLLLACAVGLHGGDRIDMLVAFVAVTVLTNVWNFMDGIDGIAASQAMLCGLAYALFVQDGPVWWLGLALAAAAAGFLPFNARRARIFLGDVGSGALGYALAALMAVAGIGGTPGERLLLLLPLLPFLLDASLTLSARILRGEVWWRPHVQHAYQAWARRRGHGPVTMAYACATAIAIIAMFAMRSFTLPSIMALFIALSVGGGLAWKRLASAPAR